MSDEPIRLTEGMSPVARPRGKVLGHICEHPGCGCDAGWGFAKPRRPSHWFCFGHKADGENFL